MPTSTDRAAKARAVRSQRSAERAIEDPRRLAQAARVVRTAIERGRLKLDEVVPDEAA